MNLTLVDVFAESRYAGNQLAVVQDATALDTADMQACVDVLRARG